MNYGYVKVCSATVPIKVADVNYNAGQIISAIKESYGKGSQVTVFHELCVSGYTCGDLFYQQALIEAVKNALVKICEESCGIKSLVFVGAPIEYGGRLYNCAVAISDGKILGIIPKTYLPNYGEFYEQRNFVKAPEKNSVVNFNGYDVPFGTKIIFKAVKEGNFTVSAEICEDLWAPESPSVKHVKAGAEIIVNLSCSDETVGKAEYRCNLVKMQSAKLVCGYVYSDAGEGESTTDMVFSGHNLIAENGKILSESKLFENSLIYSEIDTEIIKNERKRTASVFFGGDEVSDYITVEFETFDNGCNITRNISKTPFVPDDSLKERSELILSIQANALAKRLLHTGAKTVVIGISGGLDSALALLVTKRAFEIINKPLNEILAVTMPGFGTSDKTKNNSLKLISGIGATQKTVSIRESVLSHFKDIGHSENSRDVTYENAQARMRTLTLMDIANKTGGLVIGTGDLSELALGWATYNGDHMSMYGVNSSVPKTLVKYLVRSEADKLGGKIKAVLYDISETEISPELLPPEDGKITQKTEDIIGPYELHDFFLYYAIRWGFTPDKIRFLAEYAFDGVYDFDTVNKWIRVFFKRFFAQQYKRSCVPDGVKVGSVSLSPRGDWKMPSDAVSDVWTGLLS